MANVVGELGHEGQMASLPRRTIRGRSEGSAERFVVGEDVETTTFDEKPEMRDGSKYGQKFAVKSRVLGLGD